MEKQKKGMSTGTMVGIGASVAAAVAAGYLLFGPDGKKNRKTVRGWAVKMKGEIIEKLEQAKEVTEPVYHKIVDEVAAKYAAVKGIDKEELEKFVAETRKHWKAMSGHKNAKPKAKKKTTSKK
jgi:gas vesicle protein